MHCARRTSFVRLSGPLAYAGKKAVCTPCAFPCQFVIVRVLLLQRTKSLTESISYAYQNDQVECATEKRGVDELSGTLHNLIPLLLTNKTIRRTQQGSTEHGSLTINSR
jgi:hypothetical protein